ncbi:hypothetical protein EJ06DRAFT_423981 [Trichodelitschia bisporula]|uniref:C3H1-type domain-containing protein n=1 Tax=Trichodelitschia bisporula TaxID=703511 RepID=A0A6G1HW38_9PEZI|nr:hypothetical protein EJ06DRAFT_423981 [Trichodelitschia bisporula]
MLRFWSARDRSLRWAFICDVLERFRKLSKMYEQKCRDYDDERNWRLNQRDQFDAIAKKYNILNHSLESNCFVQVLIDGDGAYFHDALVQAGTDGGSDAAHKLLTEITEHVQSLYPTYDVGQWSIAVQIYANLGGLAGKLVSMNIINSPSELHSFARSFNSSQFHFSIVDVGVGKERADNKIREMFRLFLGNKQCKHIIFGGCHDNGYLPTLQPYRHDEATRSRISLLETLRAEEGFKDLNFNMARFPSVFRSEPLSNGAAPRSPPQPAYRTVSAPANRVNGNVNGGPNGKTEAPVLSRAANVATTFNATALPQRSTTPSSTTAESSPALPAATPAHTQPDTTWAVVGKAGATTKTISIAPAPKPPVAKVKVIYYNERWQRLDPVLRSATQNGITVLNARITAKGKVCNEHFLRGMCEGTCGYSHDGKLSEEELLALRHRARTRSCPQRSSCQRFDCYWGHQCPFQDKSGGCMNDSCYFLDVHFIDKRPYYKWFEDGTTSLVDAPA